MVKVPKGQIRRAGARRMRIRTRPQVKAVKVEGQTKCDICLGMIKSDLPSVLCGCGKQFHNSCAQRVEDCPICGRELGYSKQRPHVVDSAAPTVKTVPLSKEDKLLLLDERFLLGDITERTYLSLKDEVKKAPDTAIFCSICGRRLLENESCDCTLYKRTLQCPECNTTLSEDDLFCSKCGVVFSTDFAGNLSQCPQCGRIVSDDERACECGVMLVGQGNMICRNCGKEIPETASECSHCGESFVELISECPACGRRVDKDALACLCGTIFSDRVGGVECSLCGTTVDLSDKFCPKCGARFADEPRLEGKRERKVRR
ncbi:MAG TPA: zinc-ribbon domain-containing protein [Thermoplasmata archaeon]